MPRTYQLTSKLHSLLIITAAVGSFMSQPAAAANLSVDGTGQVLLYPYFTVEKGQQTAISIVNTSEAGKAIKVRFLEGYNGRQVFGFNLYLAPFDVWVGSVLAGSAVAASGSAPPAAIRTDDSSCTVPAISAQSVNFQIDQFTGVNNDSGPDTQARTREGYIEVIEMGAVLPLIFNTNYLTILPNGTFAAMQHGVDGQPISCASIRSAWVQNASASNEPTLLQASNNYQGVFGELALDSNDVSAPSGGLFGSGAIIEPQAGSIISYPAEAIDGFRISAMHTGPSHSQPTLNSAEPISHVIANGELVTSHWRAASATGGSTDVGSSIDAVSALLQARAISNEFMTDSSIGGNSEWVVTLPTRRFYVDTRYGAVLPTPTTAVMPYRNAFTRRFDNGAMVENNRGFACESVVTGFRDQASRSPSGGTLEPFFLPPGSPLPNSYCYNTQIVTINQVGGTDPSNIFGSKLALNFAVSSALGAGTMTAGTMTVDVGKLTFAITSPMRTLRNSINGHQWQGLPSIGFWAVRQQNEKQKFGGAFAHKRVRSCVIANGGKCGAN
jgi:hypothetical protein